MDFSENKGDGKGRRSRGTSSGKPSGSKFSRREGASEKPSYDGKKKYEGKSKYSTDKRKKSPDGKFQSSDKPFKPKPGADSRSGKPSGHLKSRIKYKSSKKKEDVVDDGKIRLNRFVANAGICSRREADSLIELGEISVNGKIVTELGTKIDPSDTVHYGSELVKGEKKQYVLLNKPKNYITTSDDPKKRRTVMDLVGMACKERIYPVGRLDRQTTGVLLFTNDGELTRKLTHPTTGVGKTYHVVVDKNVTKAHLIQLVEGVELEDGIVSADKAVYVEGVSKKEIGLELHSGKNRVIRRMMEKMGYQVTKLDRVLFAGLTKKNLERGKWRFLTDKEVGFLKQLSGKN